MAARLINRSNLLNRITPYTPMLSAVVVLGLGIGLSVSAFHSFKASSDAIHSSPGSLSAGNSAAPAFHINKARLIYLGMDSQSQYQVTLYPLNDGEPQALTREPGGVYGYAISPDGKTILYTLINTDGGSSIKSIQVDGSNPHIILDCPQAQCEAPIWYPDGTRLVYERLDYFQNTTAPVFTIWWLDLSSGETKPLFQDQSYPGLAPAFSPDGHWMSYVSPAANSIKVYDLVQGQVISIPLSNHSYALQIWSPSGDLLLYWAPADSSPGAALHVNRYILASAQNIDLGGANQQADYTAAWSPDGQWIAINRDATSSPNSNPQEMVWLVHPDGSQGHVLLQGQVSYSNMSWSPDGKYLLYNQTPLLGSEQPGVWMAEVNSGKLTRIMDDVITPTFLP